MADSSKQGLSAIPDELLEGVAGGLHERKRRILAMAILEKLPDENLDDVDGAVHIVGEHTVQIAARSFPSCTFGGFGQLIMVLKIGSSPPAEGGEEQDF